MNTTELHQQVVIFSPQQIHLKMSQNMEWTSDVDMNTRRLRTVVQNQKSKYLAKSLVVVTGAGDST